MHIPTRLFIAASLVPFATPLMAQDVMEDEADALDDVIVVTGQGLEQAPSVAAYAVSEVERDDLLSVPSGRIEEALGSVAGFQQFRRSDSRSSNPSAQGVTLRALGGNATSRALVLLDGVPMADPFFGYIPLSALAPERLASIRVTRGGGSGPFGAGALSGTIELVSASAATLSPFQASALINDRGETEASATVAQRLGSGEVTAFGRWDRGQGFFTTPEDQRVPASARAAFDSWSAGLRSVVPVSPDVELQARILAFRDERTLRFDGADSSSEGQDASVRLVGRGDWQFDALAYVQARNFSNIVISSTRFVRVLDQRNTPSTGLGGKLELRPPVGDEHTLRLGADYRRANGELQEEAYSAFTGALRERRRAGGINSNLGFFIEDDWRAGRLLLTGGLRANYTRIADGFFRAENAGGDVVAETIAPTRSDWSVSWRAGANYQLSENASLRAAAYTGLRLPTLNELYRPFVVFPVVTQANAALENERLEGYEIGADLSLAPGVSFSLTAFDNEVEGAIANVTLEPNLRERQNLPAVSSQGLEAAAQVEMGRFLVQASAVWSDAKIKGEGASLALDGNRPPQVPRFAAAATASWQNEQGWQIAAQLRHTAKQFEDDRETDALPSATTLSGFAQIPLDGGLQLVLRGENLTDETIVTRNANGAIDLGAPRTFWIGLRYGI
ncbi:TonB-dependent receptor [Altererythrobacter lutimaris]|uniref:TonB-dependent receptor n=1 Tax=Altererythrobacter lutimaris TaxID=2743979 RepID=A0A850HFB7_9SPHN|nr:TonB-dependent receptor [Altererythrobacter lutimaris]NVE95698.1 TonB-dependent receptor [Altererythrobacter lutimaris]